MSDDCGVLTATDFTRAERDGENDVRHLEARLKLVVDSLSATAFFNPAGVLIVVVALALGHAAFGGIPVANMVVAVGAQCVAGAAAWIVQRRYSRLAPDDLEGVQWGLVALQTFVGLCWGIVAWSLWVEGNAANNVFVGMLMLCVAWAAAFTRAACQCVFLTGVLVIMLLCATRFATADGVAAKVLLGLTPFWAAYMIVLGTAARRRVDETLKARFSNEDLGAELRLAHDDALRKRAEAEAANAAKTSFLANMSHELRTPLNAVLGFSDIIAGQTFGPNNPCYRDYARDIHTSGTHLLNLINDILDVAKIESGKMEINPQPLDVARTLAGIERLMTLRAREKRQILTCTIDGDAPSPLADERAFKQVALNLISNALKFTPEEGRIDVRCRRGENGGFLLSVEDTGPGIPLDKIEKVFQAFSQVDNRYDRNEGGTGLGLALVQGLMRLHGGRAWLESELGRGTKAFVYFPLGIARSRREKSEALG